MNIDMTLNSRVVVFINTETRGYEHLISKLEDEGHHVYLPSADKETEILRLQKCSLRTLSVLTHRKQRHF
ncbi:hypothetical protein HYT92_01250 [Candidatus Pacearchaeota archaeon]|nr:hypothetical protein [Candidatus Pacearchaeota archaeon]